MMCSLPEAFKTFFAVTNGAEMARLIACFAPNAAISDERQAYQGRDAIPSWLPATQQTHLYRLDPRHVGRPGRGYPVVANVMPLGRGGQVVVNVVQPGRGDSVVANVAPSMKRARVVAEIDGFSSGSPMSLPIMSTRVGNKVFYWGSRR